MTNVMYKCGNGLLWVLLLALCHRGVAQDTTATAFPRQTDSTKIIHLLNADVLLGIQPHGNDSAQMQKLIGNVRLTQGGTIFTCDSALQNLTDNTIDAYGHIHINQADTINTYSDFLHYVGNTKVATLRKNVRMTDGRMVLTTNLLNYDMTSHVGSYMNGGKLVNESTVLTSERGYYYADTKDAYFKRDVQLVDPQYTLATDTLLYNTNTRIATFMAPTTINTGSSIIHTTCGYYNRVENYAHLCDRSTIIDRTRILTDDSMNYTKNTGIGIAYGNLIWTDTAQKMTVLANYAVSNQLNKTIMATRQPLMILQRKTDSLFLAADTLFSGPLILPAGTAAKMKNAPAARTPTVNDTTLHVTDTALHAGDTTLSAGDHLPAIRSTKDTAASHVHNRVNHTLPPLTDTTLRHKDSTLPKDSTLHPAAAGHRPLHPGDTPVHFKDSTLSAIDTIPVSGTLPAAQQDTGLYPRVPAMPTGKPTLSSEDSASADTTLPHQGVKAVKAQKAISQDSTAKSRPAALPGDTTKMRYVKAYHHVRLFSDSLQGVSDSLYYSDLDSAFRFYKDPVLWTGQTQLTGDTIVLLTRDQQADRILLQQHGMIINQVGPGTYNQIKGTFITGFFADSNQLKWMQVNGNAESMYYAQDDQGAFVGGNRTTSAKINLYFKGSQLNKVVFLKDVDGTFLPPTKIPAEDKELKGFRWEVDRRPKSKTDLMQREVIQPKPTLASPSPPN
jgi:hypothetical protein